MVVVLGMHLGDLEPLRRLIESLSSRLVYLNLAGMLEWTECARWCHSVCICVRVSYPRGMLK